jgi:predicted secreted protein
VSWTTALAIYFVLWWVVLFAVLPWGVRSQDESDLVTPGTDPGAPAAPALPIKLFWTTVIAAVIFAVMYGVYVYRIVTLDDLATLWGFFK